jgi:AsmA protein
VIRVFKWAGIGIGALLLMGALAATVVPYLVNLERYRGILASRAGKALGREVTVGDLRVSLWRGLGAEAKGIQVAQADGFGPEPFLTADALRVNVHLLPLLRGQVKVSTAVLEQPRIRLARDKDGRWSIDDLVKGKAAPTPSRPSGEAPRSERAPGLGSLLLSQVAVRGGEFTLTDQARPGGFTVTLSNMDLSLRQSSASDPVEVRARAKLGTTGEGWLETKGRISGGDPEGFDLDATLVLRDVDVSPWQGLLLGEGSGTKATGPLSGEIKVTGPVARAAFAGKLDLKPVAIQVGETFRKPLGEEAAVQFEGSREGQGVSLPRLAISLKGTRVDASLRVPDLRTPQVTFTATSAKVDLDRFLAKPPAKSAWPGPSAAYAAPPPPKPVGRGTGSGLTAQGRVNIGDLRYHGIPLTAFEADVRYQEGLVQLSELRANLLNGKLTSRGDLDFRSRTPRVSLTSRVDNVATEPLLKALAVGPWTLRSGLSFESDLKFAGLSKPEILGSAAGDGSLVLKDGRLSDYRPVDRLSEVIGPILANQGIRVRLNEFEQVSGHFTLDKGVLRTKDLTLTKAEGTVTAAGALGLLDSSLDFDVVAKFGRATVEAKVTGTTKQPVVAPKLGKLQRKLETELDKALPGERGKGLKDLFKGLFGR